jgi:hypothetical protein
MVVGCEELNVAPAWGRAYPDDDNPRSHLRYCESCWWATGRRDRPARVKLDPKPGGKVRTGLCAVGTCPNPPVSQDLCSKHWQRFYRTGSVWRTGPPIKERNGRWTEQPSYFDVHARLGRYRGPARSHRCECGEPADEWALIGYDDASTDVHSGLRYVVDLDRYVSLCRRCHRSLDAQQRATVTQGAR